MCIRDSVFVEAVDRDGKARLISVPVADVAHSETGREGLEGRSRPEFRQTHVAPLQETAADGGRYAEEVQHDPAEAAVITQQIEIARRDEVLSGAGRFRDGRKG